MPPEMAHFKERSPSINLQQRHNLRYINGEVRLTVRHRVARRSSRPAREDPAPGADCDQRTSPRTRPAPRHRSTTWAATSKPRRRRRRTPDPASRSVAQPRTETHDPTTDGTDE